MAKESMKAREVKRAKLVARYAEKRAALKQIVRTGEPADAFEAAQKLQELRNMPVHSVSQQQGTSTPLWDEIDKIVSSLNEQEKTVLVNNKEYYENSVAIQEMVNAEILILVKGRIEASPEGKAILEQQLSFVKKMSRAAKEETAKRDALFREYMTEHSDMTWQEFIDMKNGKPKKK